jgi:hypothetical protein
MIEMTLVAFHGGPHDGYTTRLPLDIDDRPHEIKFIEDKQHDWVYRLQPDGDYTFHGYEEFHGFDQAEGA